jgi:hypothetical protein
MHTALYEPGSLILLLSPTQDQSVELFRKAVEVYHGLGEPVPAEAESVLRLELANGSRIVSRPGNEKSNRGFSGARLLIIDEASRVDDALYSAVTPILAVSGGRLVALSTPFGRRGWWYEAWASSEPWERYEVPATECSRIPPAYLEEERAKKGAWLFEQEFLCRFNDAEAALFSLDQIDRAFDPDVKPLWGVPEHAEHGLFLRPRPGAE